MPVYRNRVYPQEAKLKTKTRQNAMYFNYKLPLVLTIILQGHLDNKYINRGQNPILFHSKAPYTFQRIYMLFFSSSINHLPEAAGALLSTK